MTAKTKSAASSPVKRVVVIVGRDTMADEWVESRLVGDVLTVQIPSPRVDGRGCAENPHVETKACEFDRAESINQDRYVCGCGWVQR